MAVPWIDANAAWLLLVLMVAAGGGLALRSRRLRADAMADDGAPPPPPLPRALRHDALVAAVALGAFGFALLAFGVMAEDGSALVRWDDAVAAWMRQHVGPQALQALAALTALGNVSTLLVLGGAVALVLLARRQWLLAGVWLVGTVGNGLLVRTAKQGFQRARPEHLHGVVTESGFSFPSGHAAGALVVYGLLAYLLVLWRPLAWQRPVIAAAALLVLAIGASRIALQVHYLSDVVAAFVLALAWLVLVVGASERARRQRVR